NRRVHFIALPKVLGQHLITSRSCRRNGIRNKLNIPAGYATSQINYCEHECGIAGSCDAKLFERFICLARAQKDVAELIVGLSIVRREWDRLFSRRNGSISIPA